MVVLTPVAVSAMVGRRRSSVASFEASIRGLDRSAASAVALFGPMVGPSPSYGPSKVRPTRRARAAQRARLRRQQDLLGVALVVVAATAVVAAMAWGRPALAAQALADQLFVGYAALAVLTNRRHAPR
jgi:hypothetical protein